MNFTSDVKKELMKLPCGKEESRAALSAYFSACGVFAESGTGEPEFFLVSETERVAEFFTGLFYNLFGERLIVSRAVKDRLSGRSRLILECPRGAKNALETLELYKPGAGFTVGVPQVFKENDAARRAYICGAFLGGGSITLPADGKKTGYHLEIAFPAEEDGESAVAEEFAALAEADDLLLKCVTRGGETVAYMKSKEAISDFLSVLGAENALKKFGAFCEEREKNNNLNRAANCSSFNADKTATAAVKQVLAIEKIVAAGADSTLAAPLKKLIALRLARPELSLQELADELGVSKSCLSHRMRKLTEIAADIP
ncbi:MAG: DNA-binding protein WhiA [Lachnospiraceae bacterium]